MLNLKFKQYRAGFGELQYTSKMAKGKDAVYCFQEQGSYRKRKFVFLRCGLDREPCHEVDHKNVIGSLDFPDDNRISKEFIEWAKSEGLNFQPTEGKN